MKLALRLMLLFSLTLILNSAFAVSHSTINPPTEMTTESQSFKKKTKTFFQKHIAKYVKKRFKKIKDTWNTYKEEKKKGIGFGALVLLLTATFVVLRLFEVIMWSWFWVLSPLWITVGLFILLFLVVLIGISAMKD